MAPLLVLPKRFRRVFVIALVVFVVSSVILLLQWNDRFLVEVPQKGGAIVEGIIGRPRFINPVIAKSDADRDMVALIYSGLLKATPDGELIGDLAETYTVSADGLIYTFTLKNDLLWHDGEPVTSKDVVFTVEKARDPSLAIKSPRRASWEGVDVETPDPQTVVFRIKQPYAPFLENATMGILPEHIWNNVPNEEFDVTYHNIEPIGSGPYRMDRIVEDKARGLPQYYDLVAFKRYALGEPYVTHMRIAFFGNNKELAEAYNDGSVDQMHTVEPALAKELEQKQGVIIRAPLPRIFAAFFNQNQQTIFADKNVREALLLAVDRGRIVEEVLHGYARVIDGPLPEFSATSTPESETTTDERLAKARALLEKGGWLPNAAGVYEKTNKKAKTVTLLEFSLSIPDVPEIKTAAEFIRNDWETLGALVTVKVFDPSTFVTEVLSPRKYDVIFYGQVIGRTPDPFAYWHASQRNAPGLNIALYTNKNADKLLENIRKENDRELRNEMLEKFTEEVRGDVPAVFVYSPDFLYATAKNVKGITIGLITTESERFLDVHHWYVNSERVWKWLAP
ncbi:MAG: hypothetical protein A3C93_02130 [Candidatus Lloydbacteria bacterium RIFCSPHIGHO2_02_FULL_54_17]|uniref:Solute-binding protein family 5 domain-containing protein n=1 Tax=Candidatus Lloydbacteria bacterium RIFCSPHIGHO2_02_FULL_54_17 TaxID=1798664 RepID=A0A1G2DK30_9BACT|nr:MAG: hypothetical protein A2762_05680 [Candidatus Lloydbacteria bacterium RIFCSPHIGHO2_01_FULL_54_11]OGZ13250.1 MAG: hypothetical protein A3C93_02130 [Candidatus Lloydbacteria bacterium RIFCSPHIGHO2_02_FULL_54_17]OGZ15380.1 MAG: hypothetical protein A2948_00145 [Candidatus Lloydbacteria bacterium RIFCSPLOWO2_01_FULL_54_18]